MSSISYDMEQLELSDFAEKRKLEKNGTALLQVSGLYKTAYIQGEKERIRRRLSDKSKWI